MSSESFSLSTVFFVQTTTVVFQIHFFKSQRKIKTAAPLQSDRGPVGCDASISTKALEEGFLESFFFCIPNFSPRFPPDPQSYQLLTTNQRQPKHLKTKQLIFSHQPTHTPSRTEPNPIPSFSSSNLRAIQKPCPGKNRNPIRLAILFVHLWSAA